MEQIANLFLPARRNGHVVPAAYRDDHQKWLNHIPPVRGRDSRSPCPG